MTGQRDLASGLDKDECVSRREQVSVFVSAKRKLQDRWCRVVNLACPNGKQESASMTPLCEVVQYVPHPACDCGISLGLGDQVAQQGGGAEEAQADVGGLCEVSQHWRVCEVFGPRTTVDQRHHNLDSANLLQQITAMKCSNFSLAFQTTFYLPVLQRDDARVFCGAELVIII